jgi:hypothetical protein
MHRIIKKECLFSIIRIDWWVILYYFPLIYYDDNEVGLFELINTDDWLEII